jgi:hypothetical protein
MAAGLRAARTAMNAATDCDIGTYVDLRRGTWMAPENSKL